LVVSCQPEDKKNHTPKFETHFNTLIHNCTDNYGRKNSPVWLSMWNLNTNQYPFDFSHSDSIPCRVYLDRSVDAPGGSTLYWDLPDIAAAVEISKQTGNQEFEEAAKNYVKYYLEMNTAKNGIILWGNHYYYDVLQDSTVKFNSNEKPRTADYETETGDLHEMRPILPPWQLLYEWFPERIDSHIRASAQLHLVDSATGEFNRHANKKSEYAFLESGSILVNSLAFLYSKTNDPELLEKADLLVDYSFSNRNPETGLVINSPARDRWDQYTSTTEIGLWGLNVLKSTKYIPEDYRNKWVKVVETAITPWLRFGFDAEKGMYYGSLNVTNAQAIPRTDDYPYKPETHADIWNPLFPTHNYPLQFAECCLELYKITSSGIYQEASERWYYHVLNQFQNRKNCTLYAENYARVIHFLFHYGNIFNNPEAVKTAQMLSDEAISNLFMAKNLMFRGHTKEMRYDAVDGVGLLYFPLSWIETGNISGNIGVFF
jgi:hypothetical protein